MNAPSPAPEPTDTPPEDLTPAPEIKDVPGEFDLSDFSSDQQAALRKYVDDQKQGVLNKNQELLRKFQNLKTERDQLSGELAPVKDLLGTRTIEEAAEILSSVEQGKIDSLLKEGKMKEAYELQERAKMSRVEQEHQSQINKVREESETKDAKIAALTAKVERMTIGKVASSVFLDTDNAQSTQAVINDVEEKALALFQLDETNEPVAMRNGEPVLDLKGFPLTIKSWVREELRSTHAHYWQTVVGANAKGGTVGAANGYGTGITSRKGATASESAAFMKAYREKNPGAGTRDAGKAWMSLPDT